MKIAIAGAGGIIGQQLITLFSSQGHTVKRVQRKDLYGSIDHLIEVLTGSDMVINLAGEPVVRRWTSSAKEEIINSRVNSTRNLIRAVSAMKPKPVKFISASAIGIYAEGGYHTEQSLVYADNFLAHVVKLWESEVRTLIGSDVEYVICRFGIVLSTDGGALKKMLPMFKLGLGGRVGSGRQPFPFIHIDDVCNAIAFLVMNPKSSGTYNLVAPSYITNRDFTNALAKILKRPAILFIPSILIQLVFGKASIMFTHGQTVVPERLISEGFKFKYDNIEIALYQLLK